MPVTNSATQVKKFAVLAVALVSASMALAQVTVVKAGRVIDADSGTVLTNQVIMIKDGKSFGARFSCPVPPRC